LTTARVSAARVIERVEKERAFASAVLEAELSRHVQLSARDRALATELVYGSLRVLPWLTSELGRFAPRGVSDLDACVRAHLVVAAYQLLFTRVPPFAAVSEAVSAVRAARGPRLASFANAVLRKVATRAREMGEHDRASAIFASAPPWLSAALEGALTAEGSRAFLASGIEPPAVALRVEAAQDRDAWIERLRAVAPDARIEPGSVSPLAILARGAGKPQRLPGWTEGAWSIQDEGSQLAALAVGAQAGEQVLDACAGRGNKTGLLARAVGPSGAVDVCDSIPAKLDRLREELGRLRLGARASFAVDWRAGSGEVTGLYDRILVDAPCSGVGTLRRRPEIGLRREQVDLAEMARGQMEITSRVAAHLRPGGSLVYVVCSVLREEGEDVLAAVLRAHPLLEPAPFDVPEVRALAQDAPTFRLLPHVHGTDGYFVARLRSRAPRL